MACLKLRFAVSFFRSLFLIFDVLFYIQDIRYDMNKTDVIFDGRGILDTESLKKIGFTCYTIGKGS
ncbi:hypothetical protein GCM10022395_15390 [Snuella lapsa]|uniref:Uncharacterized protein n=1 Tax=Snuella lapsa TaxID=870481 RepID=A0ABP6XF67_9FLAO